MSTVIVYYSKYNNTRAGAKILGERLNAKVVELKELKKGNFIQAIRKKGSRLEGTPWEEIKDASMIYLMTPVWASNGVPAMNAFIENAQFSGKKVSIITFQQFKNFKNSDKVHKHIKNKIENKNGIVLNCYALLGGIIGHFAGESEIKKQIDKLFE